MDHFFLVVKGLLHPHPLWCFLTSRICSRWQLEHTITPLLHAQHVLTCWLHQEHLNCWYALTVGTIFLPSNFWKRHGRTNLWTNCELFLANFLFFPFLFLCSCCSLVPLPIDAKSQAYCSACTHIILPKHAIDLCNAKQKGKRSVRLTSCGPCLFDRNG